jgi:hypothetical protein
LEKLAEGGMGVVYLAENTPLTKNLSQGAPGTVYRIPKTEPMVG